jgi:hypothetical protein
MTEPASGLLHVSDEEHFGDGSSGGNGTHHFRWSDDALVFSRQMAGRHDMEIHLVLERQK